MEGENPDKQRPQQSDRPEGDGIPYTHIFNGSNKFLRQCGGRHGSHAGCVHDGGYCTLGYSEQGVHQFHTIGHCRLGQHKADKALEGHLRALDLGKTAAGLDYAHHEKEHQ